MIEMSVQARHQSLVSSCDSPWPRVEPFRAYLFNGKAVAYKHRFTQKKIRPSLSHLENNIIYVSSRFSESRKRFSSLPKLRTIELVRPLASADDGVAINGNPQGEISNDFEEMRNKLNQSLQDKDSNAGLVQLLHDAARIFELNIRKQFLSKKSWFSTAWLGMDRDAWAKELSYQASVLSLLQAANEISSRGDGRDRDVNVFVQRSLSRLSAPLENVIREKLSSRKPEAYDWFWSEQIPSAVTSFVNFLENDRLYAPATSVYRKSSASESGDASDTSLIMLTIACITAIMKLGPTKLSCVQFSSSIPDGLGRLMNMLVEFVPIHQAYPMIKDVGLHREFLVHFGPRAAACRTKDEFGSEEIIFWVGLMQKQLQQAIDRERIWSRLTTSESIEVLERDLAIFGYFIALGKSTQSFLFANGFETMGEPIEGFIRYLIGGSVLYYPQLSAISSYQLYVEIVCEELEWLRFYPGISSASKLSLGHKKTEEPPNRDAIPLALQVCSHWIESFIKYSKWLENPSNVKAARFLSKGLIMLGACMEELGIEKDRSPVDKEAESFDKALESIEEAMLRLEELLQELHVSSSSSGKEHLEAACSDLERIRRLKKETEFLEASFRAKAASLQQTNQENGGDSETSEGEMRQTTGRKVGKRSDMKMEKSSGLWGILAGRRDKSSDTSSSITNDIDDGYLEDDISINEKTESNKIQRFEVLRNELVELEKRVQKSTDTCDYEEDEIQVKDNGSRNSNDTGSNNVVQKKDSIIGKSLDKLKETSTDVLQGTQLLAIDTAAAMGLLRRVLIGDELTEKERQALRRTLTDLASVVPIGILMLLPVTAVGHAAMLAAIQRYVPSMIPSTYGPERLNLLRQLEKVKEMEGEVSFDENTQESSD